MVFFSPVFHSVRNVSNFLLLVPWITNHLSTAITTLQRTLLEMLSILCAKDVFFQQADVPSVAASVILLLHSDFPNLDLVFSILQAIAMKKYCFREILSAAGTFAETTETPSLLSQLLQLLSVLLQSDEEIDAFIHSSALHQVMQISRCHEPSVLVDFFSFLRRLVSHRGCSDGKLLIDLMHYLLLLENIVATTETAVNLYPRHNELAYSVQNVLQPLCDEGIFHIHLLWEETACVFMVRTEFLSLCITHLIALDDDTQLIITTLSTLTRLAQIAPFFIDAIVESEVVMNAISTTPSNLLDSSLWDALLDFLIALQAAPAGVALIHSPEIRKEIQSYEIFFRHSPELVDKMKRLFAQETPISSPVPPRVEFQIPLTWSESPRLVLDSERVCWEKQDSFLAFCLHCLLSESMSIYIPAAIHAIMLMVDNESM